MTQPPNPTPLAGPPSTSSEAALDWATAEDAYHLINGLVAQVTAANDLIALLATLLGESQLKQVVETPQWAQYQSARRRMERIQADLEKFSATMQRLAADRPDVASDEG
ncbi:MAG: hypothetical protein NZ585_13185 [Chloracidobacterium sp.]|nr:hypothetical protein [Chloracidobacterium sp.]MDW8218518.1 hypothetical protein [Acidobacteriota bacterium]